MKSVLIFIQGCSQNYFALIETNEKKGFLPADIFPTSGWLAATSSPCLKELYSPQEFDCRIATREKEFVGVPWRQSLKVICCYWTRDVGHRVAKKE